MFNITDIALNTTTDFEEILQHPYATTLFNVVGAGLLVLSGALISHLTKTHREEAVEDYIEEDYFEEDDEEVFNVSKSSSSSTSSSSSSSCSEDETTLSESNSFNFNFNQPGDLPSLSDLHIINQDTMTPTPFQPSNSFEQSIFNSNDSEWY